jgi:hypothetical protein
MEETPEMPEELPLADEAAMSPEGAVSAPEGETPEVAQVPEAVKENEPMLEVHLPHEVHTWKDFWIHLGTITVGLLIAISLEQSVEKLHQWHERHELEAALRSEVEGNKQIAEVDLAGYDEEMTWLLGIHEDIGRMLTSGGKANLPARPAHFRAQLANGQRFVTTGYVFETVVWDLASADSRLVLLPDEEARAYSLQYHYVGARFLELQISIRDALVRQDAFEAQFGDISSPTTPVLARMSPVELKEYDALVMQTFTTVRSAKGWLIALYGSNEALRQGQFDSSATTRAAVEAGGRFKNDYKKMARDIAAEDAAREKAAGKAAP